MHVELRSAERHAVITVIDDGIGVRESERERVFEPFSRVKSSDGMSVPGHGIGLALVRHVAELHGGSARLLEADRGARLEIVVRKQHGAERKLV